MWIVVQRELRELARQQGLYGLRLLGGGLMTVLLWLAWERADPGPVTSGRGFFLGLNRLLFLGIWLAGPILTADCLSREKREGTLGLLLLTPLRPLDVVVGKAFSQALRAFVFVLAALPVMVIPVLLGGVTWMDGLRLLFVQLAALGLALSAGLAASSLTADWWRARILAFAFAAGSGLIFVGLHLSAQILSMRLSTGAGGTVPLMTLYLGSAQALLARSGLGAEAGFDRFWQDGVGLQSSLGSVGFAVAVWLMSWLLVAVIVRLAAVGVQRTWRLEPPSARRLAAEQSLRKVRFGRRRWQRWRTRALERNPVRWLQSRTWDARISGWLLTGAAMIGWWMTADADRRMTPASNALLRPTLMGILAFAATASFRAERESGALELWLVTPLTPAMIVRGRWWGLLGRCVGAVLVLVGLPYVPLAAQWLAGVELSPGGRPWLQQRAWSDLYFALWLATTALFGIALSLSRLSFLPAFGLTWVMHHVPAVGTSVVDWMLQVEANRKGLSVVLWNSRDFFLRSGALLAGVLLLGSWRFALRQLAQRRFLPGMGSPRLPHPSNPGEVRPP